MPHLQEPASTVKSGGRRLAVSLVP
jgi:hypothetical protein